MCEVDIHRLLSANEGLNPNSHFELQMVKIAHGVVYECHFDSSVFFIGSGITTLAFFDAACKIEQILHLQMESNCL